MGVPVDFDVLMANHKTSSQIKSSVGGDVGKAIKAYDWETCSISLSYSLNKAGAVIENYAYEDKRVATGKVRAKKGGDDKNYIYSVLDMKVYLDKRYGIAENYKGTKAQMQSKIKGRKGIISFGYRHISIWDGNKWSHQEDYLDLWGFDSTIQNGIFFWEIKAPESKE